MPTSLERTIWGFGDGSTLTAVDSPYGRIGSMLCWEFYMPMLRMAMHSFDFDVVDHYSRPDVFQLIVNHAPTSAVTARKG